MKQIDAFLNNLTMYRLLWSGLLTLAIVSIIFAATDVLDIDPINMGISLSVSVGAAYLSSSAFRWFFGGTTTQGSPLISGLIVFFLFTPGRELVDWWIIALVSIVAMASKYLVTWHNRHIFNPAAFGAAVIGYSGLEYAGWWVATKPLAIFMVIFGFLILRKLHRFTLFFSFTLAALAAFSAATLSETRTIVDIVQDGFLSFPILFLGTVMLTEPMTVASSRTQQIVYGAIVGGLFGSGLHIGSLFMTPELALLIGNGFVFLAHTQRTVRLTLTKVTEMAPQVFAYTLAPNHTLNFRAGQYIDVTLPGVPFDSRGNRRTFSFASAPQHEQITLGIKHNEPSSAFKTALRSLNVGDSLYGHHIAGSFVLPADQKQPIVCIAGGIGITPFISMFEELAATDSTRDITLFYQVNNPKEVVFKSVLKAARQQGLQLVPVVSGPNPPTAWKGETGFITKKMLTRHLKDPQAPIYYISGPPAMVQSYKRMLRKDADVSAHRIYTDYFSGY